MYNAGVVKDVTIPEGDEQAPLHVECWPAWIAHRLVLQKNYPWTNTNSGFQSLSSCSESTYYKYVLHGSPSL